MNPSVHVEHLFHKFDDLPVIHDWTLDIQQGERVVLLGPSGSGKTTFLRIVAGLEQPSSGVVQTAPQKLAFVFQEPRLIPWCSVRENLEFAAPDRPFDALLAKLGLSGFEDYRPAELSGGMQQRVNLARALLVQPRLLILDEAFTSLDLPVKMRILTDLHKLWNEQRFTLLAVTHDPKEALFLADRILLLSKRPATIKQVIPVPDMERNLSSPQFLQQEAQLIHTLCANDT